MTVNAPHRAPSERITAYAPAPRTPRSVRWLILARLAVVVLCFCVLLIRSRSQPEPGFGPPGILALLGIMAVLSAAYFALLPRIRRGMTAFLRVQFFLDVLAVTVLVYFTGGPDSNFVHLFFASIMAASMLVSRRDSALFASLATVGLATVTALYLMGTGLDHVDPMYRPVEPLQAWQQPVARMLTVTIAFFVVAYLSGLLSQRLEMARTLNEEILQNMAEGVAVFDARHRLLFLNTAFADLFPVSRPFQLGDAPEQVFPGPEDEGLRALIRELRADHMELPPREGAGLSRPPLEIRTTLLGPRGTPHGIVLLAIDLTHRERAAQAERQAARFAAVSQMAASLAHEIRNPLTSVRGGIQEISSSFAEDSPDRRLAEIAVKECDRLDRIITNFLQFARARPIRPANARLGQVLREVELLLRSRPEGARIEIKLEIESDPWIRCDEEQLREVFLNLGVNAFSAMDVDGGVLSIRYPAGSRPPGTVALRRGQPAQGVTVTFADTGPGLDPGTEEQIFEPFYTTKPRGSGLGLAMAQRVVLAHDGAIWVDSRPGAGAAFHVWLPLDGPFRGNG